MEAGRLMSTVVFGKDHATNRENSKCFTGADAVSYLKKKYSSKGSTAEAIQLGAFHPTNDAPVVSLSLCHPH
eukprot:9474911-Pyramimonas_sp.AAC.1